MTIFRMLSIAGLAVFAVLTLLQLWLVALRRNEIFGRERKYKCLDCLRVLFFFVLLFLPEQKNGITGAARKLFFIIAFIGFGVLAITGFFPTIFLGHSITGYWLMLHAVFAPVFAICLTVLVVLWADKCRFDKNYFPRMNHILGRKNEEEQTIEKFEFLRKILFWIIVTTALPVFLSIVLSMFRIFGTEGQELLLQIHRYSAIILAGAVILYVNFIIVSSLGSYYKTK